MGLNQPSIAFQKSIQNIHSREQLSMDGKRCKKKKNNQPIVPIQRKGRPNLVDDEMLKKYNRHYRWVTLSRHSNFSKNGDRDCYRSYQG